MNVETIAIVIGLFASIAAFLLSIWIRRINNKLDRVIYLQNSKGESKEVIIDADDTLKDIQNNLNDALEYEAFVGEILKKYDSQLMHNYIVETKNHKYQVDFVLKNIDKKYFIEVKSHKRPLSAQIVSKLINQLPAESDGSLIVSKNGFTTSALELIKNTNKNVIAVSGNEIGELITQFDKFVKSEGITS